MLASGNSMMTQQLFQNQNQAYAGGFGGSYEGWPGMALKQIMGQIDLFNFQSQNTSSSYNGVPEKWQIESNNNSQESSNFSSEVIQLFDKLETLKVLLLFVKMLAYFL